MCVLFLKHTPFLIALSGFQGSSLHQTKKQCKSIAYFLAGVEGHSRCASDLLDRNASHLYGLRTKKLKTSHRLIFLTLFALSGFEPSPNKKSNAEASLVFFGRGRRTRTLKNGFGDRHVTITSYP